ncbi:MAG TPA: VOC family protein [Chitinophagaceae bacterium]|nr:VOC family protein [Chitinophagaceae bacterium]
MDTTTNSINWFEIPVKDIARAKKFYEAIFDIKLADMQAMPGMKMAGFPYEYGNGKVTGAIVEGDMHKPSMDGITIYMNADPDIQTVIDRIEKAGGRVVMPRTQITPEYGYMAFFMDTEGNKLGLHARN